MENLESFKPVYEAFLESNLTAREFCKKMEMPESRFYYWQKRIRNEAAKSNGDFLPVSINNHGGKVVLVGNNRQQIRVGILFNYYRGTFFSYYLQFNKQKKESNVNCSLSVT